MDKLYRAVITYRKDRPMYGQDARELRLKRMAGSPRETQRIMDMFQEDDDSVGELMPEVIVGNYQSLRTLRGRVTVALRRSRPYAKLVGIKFQEVALDWQDTDETY